MALTKVSYSMIQGEVINILDYGAVGDGVLATYAGTNNSAALQAAINYALTQTSTLGVTIYIPTGIFCFDTQLDIIKQGASNIRIVGNYQSSVLIYRGIAKALNFTTTSFDGTYSQLNSRITLEDFVVYGKKAVGGIYANCIGLSFIECAEVVTRNVESHYFDLAWHIEDTPGFKAENPQAVNSRIGWDLKKTSKTVNSDLALVNFYSPTGTGNTADMFIDGARDVSVYGGAFTSTNCVEMRAASNQIEAVRFFGTFFDYTDFTTPAVVIGNSADTNQIVDISFFDCYFATSSSFTKSLIVGSNPFLSSINIVNGYCSEVVPYFVTLSSTCSKQTQVNITFIGQLNAMEYRVLDVREDKRTTLFDFPSRLQGNANMLYFPAGYLPFGYQFTYPSSISRYTTAFVTGDCAVELVAATPASDIIWNPNNGQTTVQPSTLMVFEWIVKPTTTNGKSLLQLTTQNVGGGGAVAAIIDPTLVSLVQNFTNGYKRYVATYVVPSNKELVSAKLVGAAGETVYVDFFSVYGPNQYLASELLYTGAAAGFANAAFQLSKFRGLNVRKIFTGEADETYNCRKDIAATFSWNLIV